jgi:hypothetical protein
MIRFSCPACRITLDAPDFAAGNKMPCPKCGQRLQLPDVNKTVLAEPLPPHPLDPLPELVLPAGGSSKLPHRGNAVLALGIVSLFTVPIILGPIAWVMGGHDLKQMRAGVMDSAGEGATNAGRICGMIATLLSAVSLVAGCCFFSVYIAFVGSMGALLYEARFDPNSLRGIGESMLKQMLESTRRERQELEEKARKIQTLKPQLEHKLETLPRGSKERDDVRKELDQLRQVEEETNTRLQFARSNEAELAKSLEEMEARDRVENKIQKQPGKR